MQPIEIDVLTQQPIPVRITLKDGTTEIINLPRLGVDGLLPWLVEETDRRRAAGRIAIKRAGVSSADMWRVEKAVELDEAIVSDLTVPIQTPPGIERVLKLSLAMTDLSDERKAQVLKVLKGTAFIAHNLAKELSTLFVAQPEFVAQRPAPPKKPHNPLADRGSETPKTSDAEVATIGSLTA